MPMANPLIAGGGYYSAPGNGSSYDSTLSAQHDPGAGASVTASVGTGSLTAPHNTPLQVAALVIVGLAIVFGFHLMGFRFAVDVGVGKG